MKEKKEQMRRIPSRMPIGDKILKIALRHATHELISYSSGNTE